MYSAPPISIKTAANFVRAVANPIDHGGERNVVRAQLVRIEPNLILPDEAAEGSNLRNARHRLQLVPKKPILKTAQIREAVAMVVVHDGVFVNPTRASFASGPIVG